MAGIVFVAGVLVLLAEGHGVSWLAGLMAGGCAGGLIALHRAASGAATARRDGPHSERRTRAELQPLEQQGWRFLHGVQTSDERYDHIAVGRGGVILLEVKDLPGTVTMQSGEPVLQRRVDGELNAGFERVRPHALDDAAAIKQEIHRLTGHRMWVQAVVVFWSDFPAGCVVDGRRVFIHGSRLAQWLARRPPQLGANAIDEVFGAIEAMAEGSTELAVSVSA
jgi:hypothetical protein